MDLPRPNTRLNADEGVAIVSCIRPKTGAALRALSLAVRRICPSRIERVIDHEQSPLRIPVNIFHLSWGMYEDVYAAHYEWT